MNLKSIIGICVLLVVVLSGVPQVSGQTAPNLLVSQTQGVDESKFFYLGPTGMKGWMYWYNLTSVARQILVTEVRAGTPSAGVMQYRDVILGIGGTNFTSDARVAFVDAVTAAEAGNGQLHLTVYRPSNGTTTTKTIQLGITNAPLAATTPYNCDKSLAILTNYCEYVYSHGPQGGPTQEFSVWAMLGSGIPKYVNWAKTWVKAQPFATRTNLSIYRPIADRNWNVSFAAATLAQYYLYTVKEGSPDASVLPALTNITLFLAQGQDRRGQWSHTYAYPANNGGQLHGTLPGYGAVNAAGLVSLYAMALAKKCGVDHPEIDASIQKSAEFFRAHVGIGSINYGFNPPVWYVTDSNGRMGIAAHVFRALGDVEAAKWFAMMTSTYGWRDWGHTGNEFNHAWGPLAANIGGPDLVSFVQTNRLGNSPYYQSSLTMRRQPEGWFQSQAQEGRGGGRQNGHATGAYALQLAIPNTSIDATGAGYGTNFWLTAEEMEQVRIGQQYEPGGATVSHLSNGELVGHLRNFAPKVAFKMADELQIRMVTNAALRADLITMVEDAAELDTARVAALRALDAAGREAVISTVDNWYSPTNGYVLNYGACDYGIKTNQASRFKILEAISQFDRAKPFDMLLVGSYSASIYTMSTNGFSEAEMTNYFGAVEVILSPDSGNVGWFVDSQRVRYWPMPLLARFADSILRVAETYALSYDATSILAQPPIGEGMYTWMVRCGYENSGPSLVTSDEWKRYGQQALIYTNYLRRLKAVNFNYERYINVDEYLDFYLPATNPTLYWFRNLIADNITPVSSLVDLRGLMDQKPDDDLFRAVTLDKIVKHTGNTNPFDDIVNYVGYRSPIAGTHWRLYRGAVELGTNTAYSTDQQWLDALPVAVSSNDQVRIGGILHVLAGRAVSAAKPLAADFLIHDNDFVTIAALDVYRAVGAESDLVMLFNQFMTNVSSTVEGVVTFADDFKIHAYWDAIHAIVDRHSPITPATANAIAAAFNARTSSGVNMSGIATVGIPRAEPMSILSPVGSSVDKVYAKYVTGPIGILGLFPGTDCDQALRNLQGLAEERWWDRSHKYASGEATMLQKTIPEIVAIEGGSGTNRWSNRAAGLHLMSELLMDQVAVSNQLGLLRDFKFEGKFVQEASSGWVFKDYQYQLNRRRGLEETRGVHFFYVK